MRNIISFLTISFVLFMSIGLNAQCYTSPNGQWPSATFTPTCGSSCSFQNITTAAWNGEYSVVNVVSGNTYTFRSSVSTDFITVDNNGVAPLVGTSGVSGTNGISWTATFTGTVRFYTHNNSSCGSGTVSRTRSVCCVSTPAPCTQNNVNIVVTGGSYPSEVSWQLRNSSGATVASGGANANQTVCLPTGCYTMFMFDSFGDGWNGANFTVSVGGTAVSSGTLSTGSSGNVPNIGVGQSCAPQGPANDACGGAISLTCGQSVTASTVNATTDAIGFTSCGTTITTEGVWFKITGNGQIMTASTCASSTDTKLIVYQGTCAGLTCVGGNDDGGVACTGLAASVNWASTNGTTYYILAAQYSGTGTFPLVVNCVAPCNAPSNLTLGTVAATSGSIFWNAASPAPASGYDVYLSTSNIAPSATTTPLGNVATAGVNITNLVSGTTYYVWVRSNCGVGSQSAWVGSISFTTPVIPSSNCLNSSLYGSALINSCGDPVVISTCSYAGEYSIVSGAVSGQVLSISSSAASDYITVRSGSFNGPVIAQGSSTLQFNNTYTGDLYVHWNLANACLTDNICRTTTVQLISPISGGTTVDGSYTYNGNFSISSSTTGACNNSNLRASEDRIYEINISCNGTYTFQTCGGASWDTYLYLTNLPGGNGTVLASNDDNCSLQSGFTLSLNAGKYYLVVEGFSNTSSGAFTAFVSGTGSAPSISGSASNVSCNGGSNGSITATVNGNGNNATATLNGSAFNGSATGLSAGTYTVSATNCWGTSTQTFTVTEPTALSASSTSGSIACNGGSTTVTVSATGGTAPYSGTGSYTVTAGTYSYTVTDANGCTSTTSITVSEPTLLTASNTTSDFNGYGVSCNGGSNGTITVAAAGGVAPYAATGAYSNLSAGTYSYTVTDANGCTASTSGTITEPTQVTASNTTSDFNGFGVSCNGGSNGTITVAAAGGVAPYAATGAYSNLSAGTYSYTVTDANGCTASTSGTITEPTDLVSAASAGSILCFGGSTSVGVSATGGVAPYSGTGNFNEVAGTYNYTVTDANGCTDVASVTISQPDLLVASSSSGAISCFGGSTTVVVTATGGTAPYVNTGNYTVTAGTSRYVIEDANGCRSITTITVTEPDLLEASYTAGTISCFGGTTPVVVSATGGTQPYSGTGTFNTAAGATTYTVTDANGCTSSVMVRLSQPTQVRVYGGADQRVYFGYGPLACATLDATASGGTGAITYQWFDGNGNLVSSGSSATVCPSATTYYTVVATDANGCTASDVVAVCVTDVRCSAGNSINTNVEMCQRVGNANRTICVDPASVPALLRTGATLGSCREQNCTVTAAREMGDQTIEEEYSSDKAAGEMLDVQMFPNPTSGYVNISINAPEQVFEIQVFDAMGRLVNSVKNQTADRNIVLNLTDLPSGVYMVRISGEAGFIVKQIVRE